MRTFRAILAAAFVLGLAFAAAGVTLAKGDHVVATLDEPLPIDPAAGTTLRIGWKLTVTLDDGSVRPFTAEGIFIRLTPAEGAPLEVPASSDRDGHFVASLTVPESGLGTAMIGLAGVACRPNAGCTRSDEFFRIAPTSASAGGGAVSGDPASGAVAPKIQPSAAAAPVVAPIAAAEKPVAVATDVAPIAAAEKPVSVATDVAPIAAAEKPVAVATNVAPILTVAALAIVLLALGASLLGRRRAAAA